MIKVRAENLEGLMEWIRYTVNDIERDVIRGMAQVAYNTMQEGADRHTKTGALRRSVENIPSYFELERIVRHNRHAAPYAPFVVFGTRPHIIAARDRKSLRWAGGGSFIFRRWVNHPGYRGDDYATRAADEALRQFVAIVEAAPRNS